MQHGVFLFTLDTEFAWGHYDIFDPRLFSPDGNRERRTIIRILDLLDEYGLSATWAVVGRLFCKDRSSCRDVLPLNLGEESSAFQALITNNHPLLFAPDIVETLIERGARHAIGFHGFSHRVFTDMTKEEARCEIEAWLKVAVRYGIQPRTVVFPRNRIAHLDLFKEYGFLCFRGEEKYPGMIASPSIFGKALRRYYRFSSIIAVPEIYQPRKDACGLYDFPASRSLFSVDRIFEDGLRRMNLGALTTWAIMRGIRKAARQKKIFHLYSHPFEFRSEEDFVKLHDIFRTVKIEKDRGTMISCFASSLAKSLLDNERS